MCGIAGILRRDGRLAEPGEVERMLATIVHRGPDGSGLWHHGHVALGHRRLTILDTSERASQPMLTPDGQGVLVYNGETYNYRELRRELEAEGVVFRSTGDTEVVLAALHRWGPEISIPRFDGMFAIAYLDRRDGTLWLARDRLGIKTLVVAETDGAVLFASELKALFACPGMTKRVDLNALSRWIIRPQLYGQRLLFESVESVAAGSWWRIGRDGIEKRGYFHVLDDVDVDRLTANAACPIGPMIDTFERLLRQSVESHLASDVPLATMCSGGVDSSLITAYARNSRPDLQAYVADLDFARSEAGQAERVGRHLGVAVRRVAVDRERFLRLWPIGTWHSEGPLAHRSDPALLAVTQTCRQDGVKVLLTGEGSDELFGGYDRYRSVWRRIRRVEWPRSLLPGRRRRLHRLTNSVDPFLKSTSYGLNSRFGLRLGLLLDPDEEFVDRRILARLAGIEPRSDRAFIAYCLSDLYGHLTTLLHRHDRMGMAASTEMRVPFLENEIIDFAVHLPLRARLHRGQGKWIVKETAARRLPADVVYARKEGFPTPGRFTRGTERLLSEGRLAETMGWSTRSTEEIMAMLEPESLVRFYVVGVELWLRIFFGGEDVEELGERLVALAA